MTLGISKNVFITCAVTGSGSSQDKSREVPRSPKEIADSAIDAATDDVQAMPLLKSIGEYCYASHWADVALVVPLAGASC